VSYQFHKFDADDNDMCFFKVEDAESIDKINKFSRKHWGHNLEMIYRKGFNTYVKVKHENIENFFYVEYKKGSLFKTNIYVFSCEHENGEIYYPKISLHEEPYN
jgi:hypothetical protein